MLRKWWTYQAERFPLVAHGPLIAAFSFCAVAYSGLLREQEGWPSWRPVLVAFVSCLLFFLQLRIADEFKDFEEDAKFRPYRAVPRGLVSLRELGVVFALCGTLQLALALWLEPRLLVLLTITWAYLALMSKEFFVRRWLAGRPVLYMVSHMAIMPLIDLYATSTDWLVAGQPRPPGGLIWFLFASLFNGMVIEIGRKVRSPDDEEDGVQTYSALWGRRNALLAWWGVLLAAWACAMAAAARIDFVGPMVVVFVIFATLSVVTCRRFLADPHKGRGKRLEQLSGVWTLALYLGLGLLPLVWRSWGSAT